MKSFDKLFKLKYKPEYANFYCDADQNSTKMF